MELELSDPVKKINPYLMFRLISVLIFIIIVYFPMLFVPRRFHFGFFYNFAINLFNWACKIRVNNMSSHDFNVHNPVIFASNHKSFADPVLVAKLIKGPFVFTMSQHVLDKIPPFKIIGLKLGFVGIDKSSYQSFSRAFAKIKKRFKNKYSLIYFPEGYYTLDKPVGRMKSGIAKIAAETNARISPVAIYGVDQSFIYKKKLVWKDVYIKVGEPVNHDNFEHRKFLSKELENRIEKLYLSMENKLTDAVKNDSKAGV